MKDKKFLVLSVFFFLLFAVAMVALTLQPTRIFQARATVPSPGKSFIIAHYTSAGSVSLGEKIKISVYMRDENGVVLPNRGVKLATSLGSVAILPSDTVTTDANGIAEFFLTSDVSGKAEITAVDQGSSTSVANSPSIQFGQ